MRKIILGMLSIVGLVAMVSGSAFALFSDTAEVSGITFSAGNADLKIDDDSDPAGAADSASLAGFNGLKNLYPGVPEIKSSFWLQNASASDIKLRVTAKLESATNWDNLADEVWLRVTHKDSGVSTGWKTLRQWNASAVALPYDLNHGDHKEYVAAVTVDPAAGNSIANKELKDVVFKLTATQQ